MAFIIPSILKILLLRGIKPTIEIAKKTNIPILNMPFYQGEYFSFPDRKVYLFEEYPDEYRLKLTAFRDVCTAAVGNADLKICIENTRSFQFDHVRKGISILLESPVFGLTFDIGHNAGNDFLQQSIIYDNIDRLYHMHLHDYERMKGDHLPFGTGSLDLLKYLHLAEVQKCRVVLETKTIAGLKESIMWMRK